MIGKKLLLTVIFILAAGSILCASTTDITGYDYLRYSKRQRADLVKSYIDGAKRDGVAIRNRPVTYCKKMDAFYQGNPQMEKEPFVIALKTLIIMEYDWQQKGVDKDKLAKDWLGEALYKSNKERLGKR